MKQNYILFKVTIGIVLPLFTFAQSKKVLFFLAQENTYYSEYIVAAEGLKAAGYTIDVRSATNNPVTTYMVPSNTTINETANTLQGSTYSNFQNQFSAGFGQTWNAGFNNIPSNIPVNGSILDIQNMSDYDALIIAGGTGIVEYRVDGSYAQNGLANAFTVQATAEKLNVLAIDALQNGKVILAQCHGASLPVFWRVPNTAGTGVEILGESLLKGQFATGYPETATTNILTDFGVTHKQNDRVTVSNPNTKLTSAVNGNFKLITSRDWYPQTVAYATRTLLNILETYPSYSSFAQPKKVLILHGGAVDVNNCLYTNKNNDIPCNYGGGNNLPADYTDIETLLGASSLNDNFAFQGTYINLSGTLPFNSSNEPQILNYLQQFDVVVFYKHWSNFLTNELQNALVNYADLGGGVVGLHHALYNDFDGNLNKNILCSQLFGAESSMSGWSANRTTYNLINTNYGHFVSTFGINYNVSEFAPNAWNGNLTLQQSNLSYSTYPQFSVFDEIYNNMAFLQGQSFGRNQNEINALFSNNLTPNNQTHTSGFVKLFNPNLDSDVGRVVYLQTGENINNYSVNSLNGQVIRNAIAWSAGDKSIVTSYKNPSIDNKITLYPNPSQNGMVYFSKPVQQVQIIDINGKFIDIKNDTIQELNLQNLPAGLYFIKTNNQSFKLVLQ